MTAILERKSITGAAHALSEREWQVMLLLATGLSSSAIAARISLDIHTVSTYRTRILEKTGLRGNVALALQALKQKLIAYDEQRIRILPPHHSPLPEHGGIYDRAREVSR